MWRWIWFPSVKYWKRRGKGEIFFSTRTAFELLNKNICCKPARKSPWGKKKKRWRGKHSKSLQDYTPVPWNYTTISNKMVQTFLAYDIQLQIAMIIKTGTSANKVYRIKSITSIAEEELRREREKQKRGRKHCKCWKTPTPPPPKKKIRKSWDDLE